MERYQKLKRWAIFISAILVIAIMGLTMGGRERVTFVENVVHSFKIGAIVNGPA